MSSTFDNYDQVCELLRTEYNTLMFILNLTANNIEKILLDRHRVRDLAFLLNRARVAIKELQEKENKDGI